MKHGISASFKDKLITNLFRAIYHTLPIGSLCERLAAPLIVRNREWRDYRFQRPLNVVHLTDLHFDPKAGIGLNSIQEVVNRTKALNTDLILITGDFIVDQCWHIEAYSQKLRQLVAICPVYATLGNHDGGTWAGTNGGFKDTVIIKHILAEAKIELLYNEHRTIKIKNNTIQLVGLSDLWAGDFHPETAFKGSDPTIPTILLSHNPDTLPHLKAFTWDIMLAGHTHGGQVVLPFIGAPWTPIEDKNLTAGAIMVDGRRMLYVSTGTGGVFQLRYNCPAEIINLQLSPR